jgi:hypothetical protein
VNRTFTDLDALPLRFNPPDGWRTPNAQWVSLYQGFQPPPDWTPYPDAPPIPASWPWWEENGTSWFRFFRDRAPIPARALGNWFSLAALGLFTVTVSPFALTGWWIAIGGIAGVVLIVLGIRGVVRTLKTQAGRPVEPLEAIQAWSQERRRTYFLDAYQALREKAATEPTMEEFVRAQISRWWGENVLNAES